MRTNLVLHMLAAASLYAAVLSAVGCNRSGDQMADSSSTASLSSLGEPVKGNVPLACSQCMTNDKVGETLAIEGKIVQQCPASGCWFRMKDDGGEVFVDLAPAKLRLTEKREGQQAKVTGRVVKHGGQFRLEAQHVEFKPAVSNAPSSEK